MVQEEVLVNIPATCHVMRGYGSAQPYNKLHPQVNRTESIRYPLKRDRCFEQIYRHLSFGQHLRRKNKLMLYKYLQILLCGMDKFPSF